MAVLNPGKKRAFGNDAWGFAPVIADLDAPSLATELNAVGAINLSCFLLRDQEQLGITVDQVTLDSALCEVEDFQVQGATTYSMPEIRVLFDPQAADGTDLRKAWEAIDDLDDGFLWRRQGIAATTDLAAGQKVDLFPGAWGVKVPTKTNNDASGVYAFTVGFSITSKPAIQVAVAA